MRTFVSALRSVRCQASLVAPITLPHIELAPGYPMSSWAADGRNRDLWRVIRNLQNKAPHTFVELAACDGEYHHRGSVAQGLGLAHSHDGLAVSLPTNPHWSLPEVTLVRVQIDEDADDIAESDVVVRHASCVGHVQDHNTWLSAHDVQEITTWQDLWESRERQFPSLTFLPRVEDDLAGLEPSHLRPVSLRLAEINAAISAWNPQSGHGPVWGIHVTPEHTHRKQLCTFVDLDAETRVFDTHARYTPGPGRIYFRQVGAEAAVRIAYIGRKLGI